MSFPPRNLRIGWLHPFCINIRPGRRSLSRRVLSWGRSRRRGHSLDCVKDAWKRRLERVSGFATREAPLHDRHPGPALTGAFKICIHVPFERRIVGQHQCRVERDVAWPNDLREPVGLPKGLAVRGTTDDRPDTTDAKVAFRHGSQRTPQRWIHIRVECCLLRSIQQPLSPKVIRRLAQIDQFPLCSSLPVTRICGIRKAICL